MTLQDRARALPGDKLLSPAERSREAFIVRQIVHNGKNSVRTLNMELRFEGFLGKKVPADASHPHGRNLRICVWASQLITKTSSRLLS